MSKLSGKREIQAHAADLLVTSGSVRRGAAPRAARHAYARRNGSEKKEVLVVAGNLKRYGQAKDMPENSFINQLLHVTDVSCSVGRSGGVLHGKISHNSIRR